MAIVEENFPRGAKSKDDKRERHANEKKRKVESLFKVKPSDFHVMLYQPITLHFESVVMQLFCN